MTRKFILTTLFLLPVYSSFYKSKLVKDSIACWTGTWSEIQNYDNIYANTTHPVFNPPDGECSIVIHDFTIPTQIFCKRNDQGPPYENRNELELYLDIFTRYSQTITVPILKVPGEPTFLNGTIPILDRFITDYEQVYVKIYSFDYDGETIEYETDHFEDNRSIVKINLIDDKKK